MSVRPQPSSPQPGRRGTPVRWTPFEVVLIIASMALIAFPLYIEAYRWVNPSSVPAASRQQEVPTALPEDVAPTSAVATDVPAATDLPASAVPATDVVPATDLPVATAESVPSAEPTSDIRPDARVTLTPAPPTAIPTTAAPTNTPGGPTDTPVPPTATTAPTNTPGGPTATNTLVPPTPGGPTLTPTLTNTPILGAPPLVLVKNASQNSASPGEAFSFAIAVFSNSTTPIAIEVRDNIDQQLEITSATANRGTCSIGTTTVVCSVTANENNPASINITVRMRADATVGARLKNQALGQDARQFSAASDTVYITVDGGAVVPTPTTGTPPTSGPSPTSGPAPTTVSGATATPGDGNNGGNGGGNGGNNGGNSGNNKNDATAIPDVPGAILPPTPVEAAQLPPLPQPGGPTARPRATAKPGTVATAKPGSTVTATLPASPTTIVSTSDGVFFTLASDWGSAFPGQEVNYVIAARNTKASQALRNVVLSINLPANLEISGVPKSDRGDPTRNGNRVSLNIAELAPGAAVEINIPTKIKVGVAVDTRIVSQAEMAYEGLATPLYSNLVPVLIVGQATQPTLTATLNAPTATAVPPTVTAPVATAAVTKEAGTATAPDTQAYPAPTVIAEQPPTGTATAPTLPDTNSGVPISGFALFGMTLLIRTVRLHRAQSRI